MWIPGDPVGHRVIPSCPNIAIDRRAATWFEKYMIAKAETFEE